MTEKIKYVEPNEIEKAICKGKYNYRVTYNTYSFGNANKESIIVTSETKMNIEEIIRSAQDYIEREMDEEFEKWENKKISYASFKVEYGFRI